MLYLSGKGEIQECRKLVEEAVSNGSALQKLVEMVEAQGGDASVILDTEKFSKAPYSYEVKSTEEGYVSHMDTEKCGIASMELGAGRETKDSEIDYSAGIILNKKTGDYVKKGDVLAVLYASLEELFPRAEDTLDGAYTFSKESTKKEPLVFAKVDVESVERY